MPNCSANHLSNCNMTIADKPRHREQVSSGDVVFQSHLTHVEGKAMGQHATCEPLSISMQKIRLGTGSAAVTGGLLSYAREYAKMSRSAVARNAKCSPQTIGNYENTPTLEVPRHKHVLRIIKAVTNELPPENNSCTILDVASAIKDAIRRGQLTVKHSDLLLVLKRTVFKSDDIREDLIESALSILAGQGIVHRRHDGVFRLKHSSVELLEECLQCRTLVEINSMLSVVNGDICRRNRVLRRMAHVLLRMWSAIDEQRVEEVLHLDNEFHLAWTVGCSEIANALDSFLIRPRVYRENSIIREQTASQAAEELNNTYLELETIWLELRKPKPSPMRLATLIGAHISRTWTMVDIPVVTRQGLIYDCLLLYSPVTLRDTTKERLQLARDILKDSITDDFWMFLEPNEELSDLKLPDIPFDHRRKVEDVLSNRFQMIVAGWVGKDTIQETDDMLLVLLKDMKELKRTDSLFDAVENFHQFFRTYTTKTSQRDVLYEKMNKRGWTLFDG